MKHFYNVLFFVVYYYFFYLALFVRIYVCSFFFVVITKKKEVFHISRIFFVAKIYIIYKELKCSNFLCDAKLNVADKFSMLI